MITYKIRTIAGGIQSYPEVKTWAFPAGEVGVSLPSAGLGNEADEVLIKATLRNSNEVMELLMAVDAIRREHPQASIEALLPFIPYARQDRVCSPGESLSAKVMADLINSCRFRVVGTIDPHSDVLPALIDNMRVLTQAQVVASLPTLDAFDVIVAPDAGAMKKAASVAKVLGVHNLAFGNKVRNLSDGKIISYDLHGDVSDKDVLVVDDLCDGGATFVELGKKLKKCGAKSTALFVTHGIFTKGVDVVKEHYDNVYTTNSYHRERVGLVDGVYYYDVYN